MGAHLRGPVSFYEDIGWEGWREEMRGVALSQGIAAYPPLFSDEVFSLANASRRAVPFHEVSYLQQGRSGSAGSVPEG